MDSNESAESLLKTVSKGNASQSVIEYLGQYFEKRLEQITRKLCNCAPTHENLLEVRAEMKEMRHLEQRLVIDIKGGSLAEEDISDRRMKKEAKNG